MKRTVLRSLSWHACLLVLLASISHGQPEHGHLEHLYGLKPKATPEGQQIAVHGLIGRLLPEHKHSFVIQVDGHFTGTSPQQHLDRFRISSINGEKIHVKGTTGVAAANGFYYYLKNVANSSVSWSGDQLRLFHSANFSLPMPAEVIDKTILDKYRYYQNVCTASYSAVWWQWPRWQREIDWMALHGINLPLAPVGQELVYRRVFMKHFNLTQAQVDDYFTGPAFLAWNRMGNIQRYTGPLSENWHESQAALQKDILARMREFGMFSVTPTFGGHVPEALAKESPKTKITKSTDWNRFGKNYSFTSFLEPEDPMFSLVTEYYIKEYETEYGTDHFYNIDLFNEETPGSSSPDYLKKCGESVWEGVKRADPNGVWVMQGWLFVYQTQFWRQEQVKAMVTSVPIGRMLILDLFSDVQPGYTLNNGYYGVPFLWCMLHNFGGASGLYAAFNRINGEPPIEKSHSLFGARKLYSNMIGSGLTPEGIEQNPAAYEYMTDMIWWETAPDQDQWFTNYTVQRYGFYDQRIISAWMLIRESAYTDPIGVHNHGQYAINRRPALNYHSTLWYNPENITAALTLFANHLHDNPESRMIETFVYDLADVARQTVQLLFDWRKEFGLIPSYEFHRLENVQKIAGIMLQYMDWFEQLMRCTRFTLLSNWIHDARNISADTKEADYFEELARNQLTLWGPEANILDYANKHWAGLIEHYYKPRWALYLSEMEQALKDGKSMDEKRFALDVFNKVELPFTKLKDSTPIPVDTTVLPSLLDKILREVSLTMDKAEQVEQLKVYSNEFK